MLRSVAWGGGAPRTVGGCLGRTGFMQRWSAGSECRTLALCRRREYSVPSVKLFHPREKMVKQAKLPPFIRARDLAKKLGINLKDITRRLSSEGLRFKSAKDIIFSWEATSYFAESIGIEPVFDNPDLHRDIEAHRERRKTLASQAPTPDMIFRPGIVSVMGHVDHGKTTLLDALRNTDVAAREAGGITQRLSAFKVRVSQFLHGLEAEEGSDNTSITFLDTPGHKAFFRMRYNGAYLSDMVLLIIACDEGVQPQTKESYELATQAGLPVVIALNKIDLPVDTKKVKLSLQKLGWLPSSSSGTPPSNVKDIVEISAKEKRNLDRLVSTLANRCKEMNLWEDTKSLPEATIVEVWTEDGSRGRVLKVIVHCGILEVGQHFVVGYQTGRVRAIFDDNRNMIEKAMPGDPVEIVGLNRGLLPSPGDDLFVVSREKAEQVVEFRNLITEFDGTEGKYDQALINSINREAGELESDEEEDEEDEKAQEEQAEEAAKEEEEEPMVNIVLKTDNIGSLQTLLDACDELSRRGAKINIVQAGVGSVSATDVAFAQSAECPIYTFNVGITHDIKQRQEKLKVRIKQFNVFYHLLDALTQEQDEAAK